MQIKRCALALAVTAALSTAAVTGAANLRADTKPVARTAASPRHVTPRFRFPNRLRPADTVLYSQMGAVDSGAPTQELRAAPVVSDALAADDFVVPAGGWTISALNFAIAIGDLSAPVAPPTGTMYDIVIYADDNGQPGLSECNAARIPGVVDSSNTGLSILLPRTCALLAGIHWVSMRPIVDFPSTAFWLNEAGATINNPGVWENPGDAYESGCITWATLASCTGSSGSLVGNGNANFLFEVIGSVGNGAECNDGFCLTTTVSTDLTPDACGTLDTIDANVGDQLNFCYTITNNTGHDLDFHTLANNVDGALLSLSPQHVADGGTFSFNHIETVGASATYTSTWTAQDIPPGYTPTVEDPTGTGCSDRIFTHGFDGPVAPCSEGNFVDITTAGTPLNLGDDDATPVRIPFSFTLYGMTSNQLCVSNNGLATLGLNDCSLLQGWFFLNTTLPNDDVDSLGAPAIMPLWDDFSAAQGNVYTAVRGASPNREFIVEWSGLAHFDGESNADTATFEVIFGEDGALKFEYADVGYTALDNGISGDPDDCTDGVCATIGLEDNASVYDEFSAFAATVTDRSGVVWTATSPQIVAATDSVDVATHSPAIVVNPSALAGTVIPGGTSTIPFAIENHGDADLIWSVDEAASDAHFPPSWHVRYSTPAPHAAERAAMMAKRAPELRHLKAKPASPRAPFDAAASAFIMDNSLDTGIQFGAIDAAAPSTFAPIAAAPAALYKTGTFVGQDFSKEYVASIDSLDIATIDTATGALTVLSHSSPPTVTGELWVGLKWDDTTGTLFGAACDNAGTSCHLYSVDPTTGAVTQGSAITGIDSGNGAFLIDIAIDAAGLMYGVEYFSGDLVAIDKTTGVATSIGNTGVVPAYVQALDFDKTSGLLYWASFDENSVGAMYTIDATTGAVTLVGPLSNSDEQYALAIATGSCAQLADIPWLSLSQTSGTTTAAGSTSVTATIDAAGHADGDVLSGTVCATSNDPVHRVVPTAITVTVTDGTVTPPTATPSFSPTTIDTNGTSTLTITLANANGVAAALTAALTDTLPADLVVAATPNASTTCGGTVTADAGSGTVSLDATGSSIPANGSCTVDVDVASAIANDYTTTIAAGALQTSAGANVADATATLTVTPAALLPTLTKSFAPANIEPGEISKLTITLGNPNANAITMTAALTDTFPNGLVVATTPNAATDCGGPVTADAGAASVSLDPSGVAIGGAGTCTITVDVTAAAAAVLTNTMDAGALQTSAGTNAVAAVDTLTVADPVAPSVTVALSPTSVATDAPSTLTFTFSNSNENDATLTTAFSNTLPNGLQIAAAPNASTTCGGTLTANAGDDTLTLDATTSAVPANDACTITVDVSVALPGVYSPTVDIGDLQTSEGTNVAAASDNVVVTGTFPEPYCVAEATVAVEPITSVSLAGIVKTSPETIGAGGAASESEDFTAVAGIAVKPGSTHPIVVKGNTNGAFTDAVHAFVDWNHDGDFAGAGEDVDLGTIDSSSGTDAVELDANLPIPAGAKLGLTRMRVVKAQTLTDGACNDLANGQAEDYLIDIDPNAP